MTASPFDRTVRGPTWQALVSREPYGWHVSLSGRGRLPTDDEVEQMRARVPEAIGLVEYRHGPILNPYVRHFIPPTAVRG